MVASVKDCLRKTLGNVRLSYEELLTELVEVECTLHRRRRRAYAPTSNTASHDNHEKINSWVSFCFPCMGCLWGSAWRAFGPPELRCERNKEKKTTDTVLSVW